MDETISNGDFERQIAEEAMDFNNFILRLSEAEYYREHPCEIPEGRKELHTEMRRVLNVVGMTHAEIEILCRERSGHEYFNNDLRAKASEVFKELRRSGFSYHELIV